MVIATAASGAAQAQSSAWTNPTNAGNRVEMQRQMREIVRLGARSGIESTVRDATNGNYQVSSRDRSGSLSSRAHDRGAVDVVTPQTGTRAQFEQAREVSRRLGSGYTAIVEEPIRLPRGVSGPTADRNTSYSNGYAGNVRYVEPRATGVHTHVQPNFEIARPTCNSCGVR